MKKQDGFYFIPKKWLGDANIIAMDWDCKGMHLHLMALAWQQEQKGHLLDDDKLIRKLLGNPDLNDWEQRIKPQIFSAWKKTTLNINGVERSYWMQPGILKTVEQVSVDKDKTPVKKTRARKKPEMVIENPDFEGFDLTILLDEKPTTTILHETVTQEERGTIWSLGIKLLQKQGESDAQVRRFIGKIIKKYGEQEVAKAIANMSLKAIAPAEAQSYLVGILNKQQTEEKIKKGTGRGFVSI